MLTARKFRAGASAVALALCGGIAIAFAVALVTAPLTPRLAVAQTAANPNDQPTAGTLPAGTSTVKGGASAAEQPTGQSTGNVSPPRSIQSSTDIVAPSGSGERVDPAAHLSPEYRRDATE